MTIREVNFLQSLHTSTPRNYLERVTWAKPRSCEVAKQWGKDYWDGDRRYGYGGYKYDGRWLPLAEVMAKHYGLTEDHRILDIGCGKGALLCDLAKTIHFDYEDTNLHGIDISSYAIADAELIILQEIASGAARYGVANATKLPYPDSLFDFVYSINVFHNLGAHDLKQAVKEMMRVSRTDANRYICVESYRNEQEKFNLQCWALTCQQFHSPEDWKWLLEEYGYDGDVEFIYFT